MCQILLVACLPDGLARATCGIAPELRFEANRSHNFAMNTTSQYDGSELYRRVDEVLHYRWDPCGVSDAPQARDEYYDYLPGVFRLLLDGATSQQLAQHLAEIERSRVGLLGDAAKLAAIGEALVAWRSMLHYSDD